MKSSCTSCGKLIEYEASSAGLDIACPHCGKVTKLAAYSVPPPIPQGNATPATKRNTTLIVVLVIGIGLFLAVPIIGLLAAIAIPNFIKARQASQTAACVANLKMIDAAKASWALEHKKTELDVPGDQDLFGTSTYIKTRPVCPAGGTYEINPVMEKPTCTALRHALP
jgi:competence protein ComGC